MQRSATTISEPARSGLSSLLSFWPLSLRLLLKISVLNKLLWFQISLLLLPLFPFQGFLCVFSITERSSFDHMDDFRDQILRVHDTETMPMLLVGNKSDMEAQREVSADEARRKAQEVSNGPVRAEPKARSESLSH